jgi:hypothetical protein
LLTYKGAQSARVLALRCAGLVVFAGLSQVALALDGMR